MPCVIIISTDREKFRLYFCILLYKIPCGDPQMSPFYLLLSILKDRQQEAERYSRCITMLYSSISHNIITYTK